MDNINHPQHYSVYYTLEVIELTKNLGFCLGNVVKYVLRAPYKRNAVEDLGKARWYLRYIRDNGRLQKELLVGPEKYSELRQVAETFGNHLVEHLIAIATTSGDPDLSEVMNELEQLQIEAEARSTNKSKD